MCITESLCVCSSVCSVMSHSANPWTVACKAPLSIGFPRQEYCSGSPFPPSGDLPNPRLLHWPRISLPLILHGSLHWKKWGSVCSLSELVSLGMTPSSALAWRVPATGSLVGCRLWGRTESDTTEATQPQQQKQGSTVIMHHRLVAASVSKSFSV